ncbi:MAG: hypothetical protein ACTJLL_04430 [Anaplasma sp.]
MAPGVAGPPAGRTEKCGHEYGGVDMSVGDGRGFKQNAGKAATKVAKALGTVVGAATTPLKTNENAASARSVGRNIGNVFGKIRGKGSPYAEEYDQILNSPKERKRGNDISPSYARDGRLVVRMGSQMFSEGALEMLDAADTSPEGKIDPSSKGFYNGFSRISGFDFERWKDNKDAHAGYKKLCDLRAELKSSGGTIAVERTQDGFGRMLKVSLNVQGKTEKEIQAEVEKVFNCLGMKGNTLLAGSIAKALIRERDKGHKGQEKHVSSKLDAQASPDAPAASPGEESATGVSDEVPLADWESAQESSVADSGVDSPGLGMDSSGGFETESDVAHGLGVASSSSQVEEIPVEHFSLSVPTGHATSQFAPGWNGSSAAERQTDFLNSLESGKKSQGSEMAQSESPQQSIDLDVHAASLGLDGVTQGQEAKSGTAFSPSAGQTAVERASSHSREV